MDSSSLSSISNEIPPSDEFVEASNIKASMLQSNRYWVSFKVSEELKPKNIPSDKRKNENYDLRILKGDNLLHQGIFQM